MGETMSREQAAAKLVAMMAGNMSLHRSMSRSSAKDAAIGAVTDKAVDLLLEVDALRAALTEKDREIDELNGTIAKYADDDVRYLGTLAEKDREIERLKAEFRRINVQDPELMERVRGFVNAEHGLVVDMQDGTGRTGLYVETGFLRGLLGEIARLEAVEMSRDIALACEASDHKKTWETLSASQAREREAVEELAEWRKYMGSDCTPKSLSDAMDEDSRRMAELLHERDVARTALTAARKALVLYMRASVAIVEVATKNGWDGQIPDELAWVKDAPEAARAALNGDSHAE